MRFQLDTANCHMTQGTKSPESLKLLTIKQCEALDLLVKYKTSKEISRQLGISPHTVDQRIESAKRKLGVSSRGDLAQAYLMLRETCQQTTYEKSLIEQSVLPDQDMGQGLLMQSIPTNAPERIIPSSPDLDVASYRVGPELFTGESGTLFRLLAIFGIAVASVVALLGVLAIFVQVTSILAK